MQRFREMPYLYEKAMTMHPYKSFLLCCLFSTLLTSCDPSVQTTFFIFNGTPDSLTVAWQKGDTLQLAPSETVEIAMWEQIGQVTQQNCRYFDDSVSFFQGDTLRILNKVMTEPADFEYRLIEEQGSGGGTEECYFRILEADFQ